MVMEASKDILGCQGYIYVLRVDQVSKAILGFYISNLVSTFLNHEYNGYICVDNGLEYCGEKGMVMVTTWERRGWW